MTTQCLRAACSDASGCMCRLHAAASRQWCRQLASGRPGDACAQGAGAVALAAAPVDGCLSSLLGWRQTLGAGQGRGCLAGCRAAWRHRGRGWATWGAASAVCRCRQGHPQDRWSNRGQVTGDSACLRIGSRHVMRVYTHRSHRYQDATHLSRWWTALSMCHVPHCAGGCTSRYHVSLDLPQAPAVSAPLPSSQTLQTHTS